MSCVSSDLPIVLLLTLKKITDSQTVLCTSKQYLKRVLEPFNQLQQNRNVRNTEDGEDMKINMDGIVVLDCFAGIGTALVVLKRLNIKIKTVIHVEKDKVATHVYRWNHDSSYNPKCAGGNDGIKHVFVETFEDLYNDEGQPHFDRLFAMAGGMFCTTSRNLPVVIQEEIP